MSTDSSILAKIPWTEEPAGYSPGNTKNHNRARVQAETGEIPHYAQDDGYLQKSKYWGKIWRNWNSHTVLQLL